LNDVLKRTYQYNSLGKIQEINRLKNNLPWSNASFVYNASGQLVKVNQLQYNIVGNSVPYEYDAAGLLIKETQLFRQSANDSLELYEWYSYEYDAAKKLIRQNIFRSTNPTVVAYLEFTYPAVNKVVQKRYYMQSGSPFLASTTEMTFDSQKSPFPLNCKQ
jgi:hypothetical protein